MNEPCPRCQQPYDPALALGGYCLRCMMDPVPEAQPTLPPGGKWEPPSPAEAQELFPSLEIIELIGRGGMGAVYKARQPKLDRLVAVKLMPDQPDTLGIHFAERFLNEAKVLAKLSHPGIVHIYDFGDLDDGSLYYVMELVDGADLGRVLASHGHLSGDEAASITADVCSALHFAHQAGIVHRDVKPGNVLMDRQGRVKVADFGLAKVHLEESGFTTAGMFLGTPEFASPEACSGGKRPVDHRADLYAVGVMLYNMLTGELPRGVFAPPSQAAKVAEKFDAIVSKAMQADPERRYQSAAALEDDVKLARAAQRQMSRPKRRWLWPAAGAAVLAAIFLLNQPSSQPSQSSQHGQTSQPTPSPKTHAQDPMRYRRLGPGSHVRQLFEGDSCPIHAQSPHQNKCDLETITFSQIPASILIW